MRKKLVKVRCKRCRKMFVTDNFNKMIMRVYTTPLCEPCREALNEATYKAIMNKLFRREDTNVTGNNS